MPPSSASESVVAVIRELALAWQKLSLYQEGHPQRDQGSLHAHRALTEHLSRHGVLALGVSRNALVGPDGKLTSEAAEKLAQALHRRSVALIRFEHGVSVREIKAFLEHLPLRPDAPGEERSWKEIASTTPHIQTELLDFSELVEASTAKLTAMRASLWDRILEKLLQGEDDEQALDRERTLDEVVSAISALLERYRQGEGVEADGGVPKYVSAFLSEALREAVGGHLEAAPHASARGFRIREIVKLLRSVPTALQGPILDTTLRELLGGEIERSWLRLVAESVEPQELVASLRRLRGDGFELDPEVLIEFDERIDAGARAPLPAGASTKAAIEARAAELAALFGKDDVDRIHPAAGPLPRAALRIPKPRVDPAPTPDLDARLETLAGHRQAVGMATALVELLRRALLDETQAAAVAGRLHEVFLGLLAGGRVSSALRLAKRVNQLTTSTTAPARLQTIENLALELGGPRTVTALVDSLGELTPGSHRATHQLIDALGAPFLRGLLLALGEESDRSRRRRIFDLLAALGPRILPHASALLADPRWYVVRNILSLLHITGTGLSPKLVDWALRFPDARVRLEGVKCLTALGSATPTATIERALADDDPRVVEATVVTLGTRQITSGLQPLVSLLGKGDRLRRQRELRIKALQALGQMGDPAALPGIKHLFRGLLGGINAEERRAAFASLAQYPRDARQPFVASGLRSSDSEVRALCKRLRAQDDSPRGPR